MTKEEMMDEITRRFGLEAPETIKFCTYCERFPEDKTITDAYMWLMSEHTRRREIFICRSKNSLLTKREKYDIIYI